MTASKHSLNSSFPPIIDYFVPTEPMPLTPVQEISPMTKALDNIAKSHAHIAKAIRLRWGTLECMHYINDLILNGGDGVTRVRQGFSPDMVLELMTLSTLHEQELKPRQGALKLSPFQAQAKAHEERHTVWGDLPHL